MEAAIKKYSSYEGRYRFIIGSGKVEVEFDATQAELEALHELIQEELGLE